MTVTNLLFECRRLSISLSVEGGRLKFRAPKGAMPHDLLNRLSARKAELIRRLDADPGRVRDPSIWGQNGHNGQNPPARRRPTPPRDDSVPTVHSVPASGSPAYLLVSEPGGLRPVLQAVDGTVLVGLDLETTGLDPRADRVRLLTVDTDTLGGGRFTYVIDCFAVDPTPLFDVLAEKQVVFHNGAFDLQFLYGLGFAPGAVQDTMLLSQLLHGTRTPRGFHTLASCVARELGRTLDKAAQTSDWSGALTPEQVAYAALDAQVLYDLDRALDAQVRRAGLGPVADIEHRCLPAVAWLSASGAPFDRAAWEALAGEARAEAEALAARLNDMVPDRPGHLFHDGTWNWDSPARVKEAFAALGIPLAKTADDALVAAGRPVADLLRRYRAATKRATTYGPGWGKHVAADGRVHAGWAQLGADSGRMACRTPNLQNLPRDPRYRRCFRAPEGRVLVKADYSQIELRIAAKVTGDAALLEVYRRGEDLHTTTARNVLGVEEVTKEHRQLAKALNFGLVYGMGAERFRGYARSEYGLDLSADQAAAYRKAFFVSYPGLAAWHRQTGRTGDRPVETRTLAGRRRRDVVRFTEKLNTPVQGAGADGLKLALALLWERHARCPGAFPVLAVHDEIVVECDVGQGEAVSRWLKGAMIDALAPLLAPVPVEVEVKVGRTWGGD